MRDLRYSSLLISVISPMEEIIKNILKNMTRRYRASSKRLAVSRYAQTFLQRWPRLSTLLLLVDDESSSLSLLTFSHLTFFLSESDFSNYYLNFENNFSIDYKNKETPKIILLIIIVERRDHERWLYSFLYWWYPWLLLLFFFTTN